MHTSLTFGGGFVAMPDEIVRLPISDGAYRLLSLLCTYADRKTGTCFPSLSTLADLQGKSKAAISGYLKELRAAGLVTTEQEVSRRSGHGGLTFLVTFWSTWRQRLRTRKDAPEQTPDTVHLSEQPVQSVERPRKNQIHSNHTPTPVSDKEDPAPGSDRRPNQVVEACVQKLVAEWQEITGRAPYPAFDAVVTDALVQRTRAALSGIDFGSSSTDQETISADIENAVEAMWFRVGVSLDPVTRTTHAKVIGSRPSPLKVIDALDRELAGIWQPHWKRPSSEKQLRDLIEKASKSSPDVQEASALRLLKGYLARYERMAGSCPAAVEPCGTRSHRGFTNGSAPGSLGTSRGKPHTCSRESLMHV